MRGGGRRFEHLSGLLETTPPVRWDEDRRTWMVVSRPVVMADYNRRPQTRDVTPAEAWEHTYALYAELETVGLLREIRTSLRARLDSHTRRLQEWSDQPTGEVEMIGTALEGERDPVFSVRAHRSEMASYREMLKGLGEEIRLIGLCLEVIETEFLQPHARIAEKALA